MNTPTARVTISLSSEDKAMIEQAVDHAGAESTSAWLVHAAREQARWQLASKVAAEIAEDGEPISDEDRAWARAALGIDR